jgi:hypothetical protein
MCASGARRAALRAAYCARPASCSALNLMFWYALVVVRTTQPRSRELNLLERLIGSKFMVHVEGGIDTTNDQALTKTAK